ncbi:MAG: hypothetical protein E7443_07080 [Ruminococcaceae bacterium]|nr:hypothetical protein [Oscillospiraceae bacterium]
MKLVFDGALWPVLEQYSSRKECEIDYMANDINSEISRVMSWVETELKSAIDGYNSLKMLIDSTN